MTNVPVVAPTLITGGGARVSDDGIAEFSFSTKVAVADIIIITPTVVAHMVAGNPFRAHVSSPTGVATALATLQTVTVFSIAPVTLLLYLFLFQELGFQHLDQKRNRSILEESNRNVASITGPSTVAVANIVVNSAVSVDTLGAGLRASDIAPSIFVTVKTMTGSTFIAASFKAVGVAFVLGITNSTFPTLLTDTSVVPICYTVPVVTGAMPA